MRNSEQCAGCTGAQQLIEHCAADMAAFASKHLQASCSNAIECDVEYDACMYHTVVMLSMGAKGTADLWNAKECSNNSSVEDNADYTQLPRHMRASEGIATTATATFIGHAMQWCATQQYVSVSTMIVFS